MTIFNSHNNIITGSIDELSVNQIELENTQYQSLSFFKLDESKLIVVDFNIPPIQTIQAIYKNICSGNSILLRGDILKLFQAFRSLKNIITRTISNEVKHKEYVSSIYIEVIDGCLLNASLSDKINFELLNNPHLQIKLSSLSKNIIIPIIILEEYLKYESDYDLFNKQSFFPDISNLFNHYIGSKLVIHKGVLVPDYHVLDFIYSVMIKETKIFEHDIKNRILYEPCSGSGIISLLLANLSPSKIICSDIDYRSVISSRQNLDKHLPENINFQTQQANGLIPEVESDTIFVNPPWYGKKRANMSKYSSRCFVDEDYLLLQRIFSESNQFTDKKGVLYVFLANENPIIINKIKLYSWKKSEFWQGKNLILYRFVKK